MSLDFSPSVPSRVVEIFALEFAEDAPKSGTVTFSLDCDLRHPASGTILAAGSRTVHLVDGKGQLRIFTDTAGLTSDHMTRQGDPWGITVKKSWQSHPYQIRVPAGTGPISLAEIPAFDWRTQ
ncbi:hypothetical protein [Brachybacterium massiliense]|uniref:hypothetical protein n=1 Tax=Brachybacterium massiliense TaxID=1755098 RepID=UPI000B3BBB4B|nr:hypothetical protein [Brachybacterium massiliense]